MKTYPSLLSLSAAVLLTLPATAQIAFGGRPIGLKAEKIGLQAPVRVTLPAVDAQALMAEDADRQAQGIKGPYRFGQNHAVDLSTENSGTWNDLADGTRLWRLRIECPQALSINFVFTEYVVPEGAKVYVYNDAGEWLGAFTQESSAGASRMGVTQLAGDAITVELEVPPGVQSEVHLRIGQVTHAYRDVLGLMKGLGDSGSCNNNVICPEGDDWRDEIASVAMITVGGNGLCTGSLINNCANDGTPYFLTANHCTQGANVGTWTFRFNWESPTCTPTTNGPTNQTVSGSTLLENNAGSDMALLQLNSTPPENYDVYYSGWDATGTAPSSTTCIHHPSGDIKKISFENNASPTGSFGGAQCWHITAWDDGTTEPGSSGAGLWNQDHHIIGQLFGGTASCGNNVDDYFGRFDVSFPLLSEWLGGCGEIVDGWGPNSTPLGLDASLNALTGIADAYCNESTITPSITVKNNGTLTITQFTYSYNLDGGANTTNNWTGTLAAGATQVIALGTIPVGNGVHVFNTAVSSPNGATDENPGNDSRNKTFTVANPGTVIELNITLDDYGSETSWELSTDAGAPVASGGPYADNAEGTVETELLCLADGCYVLNMLDDYSDGICCLYGDGDYEVVDQNGAVLVNGNGEFGANVETPFCVSSVGIRSNGSSAGVRVFPNPSTGLFDLLLPMNTGVAMIMITDAQGRLVQQGTVSGAGLFPIDGTRLANGHYQIQVIGSNGRVIRPITITR